MGASSDMGKLDHTRILKGYNLVIISRHSGYTHPDPSNPLGERRFCEPVCDYVKRIRLTEYVNGFYIFNIRPLSFKPNAQAGALGRSPACPILEGGPKTLRPPVTGLTLTINLIHGGASRRNSGLAGRRWTPGKQSKRRSGVRSRRSFRQDGYAPLLGSHTDV